MVVFSRQLKVLQSFSNQLKIEACEVPKLAIETAVINSEFCSLSVVSDLDCTVLNIRCSKAVTMLRDIKKFSNFA